VSIADAIPLCSPLRKLLSRYLILDILGQGTFGQVVKCQNMKTHEIVAVKVVKNKPAYFNQSMMEVTILELVSVLTGPAREAPSIFIPPCS
jgi:dual specificity protein kinase YAK1